MVGRISCKSVHSGGLRGKLLFLAAVSLVANRAGIAHGGPTAPEKTERAPAGSPLMLMTPDAVTFADVPVGDTYSQTVRVTNAGEETIQIREIRSSNAAFRVSGIMLPVVVAHGTSESFTIVYKAKAEGQTKGQIAILTGPGNAPVLLNVRASAEAGQTELTASEAGIDFEDVAVGSSSRRELLLTNSGNHDVTISAVTASGAGFNASGSTAVHLTAGQSISIDVSFAPRNSGRQNGHVTVLGPDGASLLTIPLSATAAPSSQSTVRLNWEESPVTVAGYVVYRSAEPSGPFTRISPVAVPAAEFIDTGLAAGHTYYYVVASLDGDQAESEYSAPIVATIPEG
jgi:Abnormal spindle-like microcephaly-assoc'd, ASPM-SPD-2-Hydin/Transmembrane protein 131-like N-terminal